MRTGSGLLLGIASLGLLVVVAQPASAQVTIKAVQVIISDSGGNTQSWCDHALALATPGCNDMWLLPPGGQLLNSGETMVLTQLSTNGSYDFDTSEGGKPGISCGSTVTCTVTVYINSGSGLVSVYSNGAPSADNMLVGGH